MNLEEFAELIGSTASSVSRYERGAGNISKSMLLLIHTHAATLPERKIIEQALGGLVPEELLRKSGEKRENPNSEADTVQALLQSVGADEFPWVQKLLRVLRSPHVQAISAVTENLEVFGQFCDLADAHGKTAAASHPGKSEGGSKGAGADDPTRRSASPAVQPAKRGSR